MNIFQKQYNISKALHQTMSFRLQGYHCSQNIKIANLRIQRYLLENIRAEEFNLCISCLKDVYFDISIFYCSEFFQKVLTVLFRNDLQQIILKHYLAKDLSLCQLSLIKWTNLYIFQQSKILQSITQMSDSDSQPEQHFNIKKMSEQDQPHIRQILSKGKKILPSYDDQALYGLFKRYYSVENIFLNELNIIAKRMKGDNEDDKKKGEWINVGRQVRTKVNKSKYNFLEDSELLRRAENYLKNKMLAPERRHTAPPTRDTQIRQENRDNQARQENKRRENVEQPASNNRSYQDRRPKQKFVEKVEDVKAEQKPAQVKQEQKVVETKKVESPVKEQKYKEKVQVTQPVAPTKVEQKTAEHKVSEHKAAQHKPVQPKAAENKTTEKKASEHKTVEQKPVENKPVEHKTQQHSKHEEKKPVTHVAPISHQKQQTHKKEEPVKPTQQPTKPVQHAVKPVEPKHPSKTETVSQHQKQVSHPAKEPQSIPSSHSIPTVQNFDPVEAAKNFEQACNQNSFVLKFIQPQAYPQRISYIRAADGSMKNVQIRITGTSTQGSQKTV